MSSPYKPDQDERAKMLEASEGAKTARAPTVPQKPVSKEMFGKALIMAFLAGMIVAGLVAGVIVYFYTRGNWEQAKRVATIIGLICGVFNMWRISKHFSERR